jgi:LruC domain-containing protein
MNDVVIDYNIVYLKNAANHVSKMRFNLTLRAFGGGYRNGFAFEMPFPASDVSLVTGNSITENYLNMSANGLESGQFNAVIVAFDNSFSLMYSPGGGFINTEVSGGWINETEITVEAVFVTSKNEAACGTAPFNLFIIANQQRGYEVHLPDYASTAMAAMSLFGTGDDDSNAGQGRFYKSENNLPWAIHLPSTFFYPVEREPINQAYLKFGEWAESGGTSYSNWFEPISGYRDNSKIY